MHLSLSLSLSLSRHIMIYTGPGRAHWPVEPAPVWSLDQARRQPGSHKLGPAAAHGAQRLNRSSENSLKIIHSSHGSEDHYMVIRTLGLVMVSALLLTVPNLNHLPSVSARLIREKPEPDKYSGRQLMVTTINKCPNVLN